MEFQIILYSSMNEFISAAQNQITGGSRNIKLSDNTYAYINSQGVAKKFNNMADYTATMGKNGCPGAAEPVDRTWANVQYRVGAPMMAGQSCGNENKLVTSKLGEIDTEMDKAYYETVTGKTFTTLEEATSDWQHFGRGAGIAPFNGAVSMQKLNTMGYVDVDSVFHTINPTISNTYKDKIKSYVRGAEMKSCLPSENINFRDKVYIKYENSFLYADGRSVKVYTGPLPLPASCEFYIQVPIKSVPPATTIPIMMYSQTIAYGDKCLISKMNTWNTDNCGYWGCYTSKISNTTFSLSDSSLSTNLRFVSTTGISNTTTMQFGEQFNIVGEIYKNVLRQGDYLETLISGAYRLSFTGGKLLLKNTETNATFALKENINSSAVKAQWVGSVLYFLSATGQPLSTYMYMATGCTDDKCTLVLANTGLLKVVSSSGVVLSKSSNTIPDSVDIPIDTYATIVNDQLSFSENISDKKVFTLINTVPATNKCDLGILQTTCNNTNKCVGFIHSPTENTWQPIKSTDRDSDYKISATDTDVYLRYTSGKLTGSYCPTETSVEEVTRKRFSSYKGGPSVTSETANCTERPRLVVPAFENYLKSIDTTLSTPLPTPVGVDKLKTFPSQITPLIDKYETNYTSILNNRGKPTPLGNTLQQRLTDTHELDEHYRSMAILWGVITIAMISIILFRPKN